PGRARVRRSTRVPSWRACIAEGRSRRDHLSVTRSVSAAKKKGGVIESPTWVRVAGGASGRGAWYTRLARAAPDQLHSADAAAPLPPSRRPRLPHRPRGVGRGCRGRGDDLGPRGRHVPRTRHVRRRAPADLPQRPRERPLLLLLRGAQAVAGRGGRRSRAGGSARPRAAAPATVSGRRRARAAAGPRGRGGG